MSTNVRDFNLDIERFARSLPEDVVVPFQKKIALQVLRGVVLKTPVDTGRARGNWQTTIGDPAESPVESLDPSGGTTISQGLAALAPLPAFAPIFISNNVAYITQLEEGSSRQAPNGMVALTLQEVRTQFG